VHNTLPPVSDLVWQGPPQIAAAEGMVTLDGVVLNQGTGRSPDYGFWVELTAGFRSREGSYEIVQRLNSKKISIGIDPGTTAGVSITSYLPSGDWTYVAMIDSTDLVPEIDETNNYFTSGPTEMFTGTVDLEILGATVAEN